MRLEPLGDQAWMASFDRADDASVFAQNVRGTSLLWLIDVVQAYASVAVFYDARTVDPLPARAALARIAGDNASSTTQETGRLHAIPCCYDKELDLDRVADSTGKSRDEIIALHTGTIYRVYAIGFCPGFPYLGYLPDELAGVPRLPAPRLRVEAGSVGLTGRQTGIYTEPRPGGWNLVGRTPLLLVDVAAGYFPLRTCDRVQFVRIEEREFERLRGERL